MRNWVYGFFMCWGMFLSIPCPAKIWDEKARQNMIACLPFVGDVVGAVWALVAWGLGKLCLPGPVRGMLLLAVPFFATGFIHLDGFMDVCDAVLSRRDLATRQKILKDSHCGAFAVICLCFLLLAQWSCLQSRESLALVPLALIPVASRGCAGLAVMYLRPMGTSQYAAMERKGFSGPAVCLVAVLLLSAVVPVLLCGRVGFAPLATMVGYGLGVWYGYRNLDGMSGDISGFALTVGELAGVAVLTIL